MLQYHFTSTRLFESESRNDLPSDAEMFVITAALLLVHDAAYADLACHDLQLSDEAVNALVECIEYRLHPLARDFGDTEHLRRRLQDFVGLRIGLIAVYDSCAGVKSTGKDEDAGDRESP